MLNTVSWIRIHSLWRIKSWFFFLEELWKNIAYVYCYVFDWHLPHFILLPVIRLYLPRVVVIGSCLFLEALCARNLFVCYCYTCLHVYLSVIDVKCSNVVSSENPNSVQCSEYICTPVVLSYSVKLMTWCFLLSVTQKSD